MAYLSNDTGAVTVDWVVLTAGLVGLGMATMAVVSTGVQDTSGDIEDQLTRPIISSSFADSGAAAVETIDLSGLFGAAYFGNDLLLSGYADSVASHSALPEGTLLHTLNQELSAFRSTRDGGDAEAAAEYVMSVASRMEAAQGRGLEHGLDTDAVTAELTAFQDERFGL